MKPSVMLTYCFWLGFVTHSFLRSAWEQWFGQEEMALYYQENWTQSHWLIWVVLALGAVMWYNNIKKKVNE